MRILLQEFNSLVSSLKRNVTFIKQILTHCLINYRLHLQLAGQLQLCLQVEILSILQIVFLQIFFI